MLSGTAGLTDWHPRTVDGEVAAFAWAAVARAGPISSGRRRDLLWATAQLGAFCQSKGLGLEGDVVFSEAAIERFIALGCTRWAHSTVRTLRTNLRFVARHQLAPAPPPPAALSRERAKRPYSGAQIAAYLALADAQPTQARRQRANGIICLGAGAGLTGIDLRAVRGTDVVERSGGVLVEVHAARARVVPVLAGYAARVLAAAAFCGDRYIVGGVEAQRRNVTTPLIASLSGGGDLPRLELPRLRATWLATVAETIGLATFMAAAGISCSQRLGDVVGTLVPGSEAQAVALLGAAC